MKSKNYMKAIIIAAGRGSRLNPLTNDKPKCMLELDGKTLLQHQIEALNGVGIHRIVLIKGYKEEMINYPGLIYYLNDDYENNNILHSLFYAEKEMDDAFIAAYSDILYTKDVVERLLDNKEDIAIVVDIDWKGYYKGRTGHPIEEAENVILDTDNNVVKIGKVVPDKDAVHGEFIGMLKCSRKGACVFRRHFNNLRKRYSGKRFQAASLFEKAYLTDMIQDLVDSRVTVNCVTIKGGWKEIDTVEDYERILKEFSE